jgi:ribokinase
MDGEPETASEPTKAPSDGLLALCGRRFRFHTLIGTGGIGTGRFFLLRGNHTLGREESRGGRFLDRRDYCKLHILCHYLKVLLGAPFAVLPIGRVGGDAAGVGLLEEMRQVGLDLRFVAVREDRSTLFSFCFLYPDGSGGNMSTEDSASEAVSAEVVDEAEGQIRRAGERGIALAVPEVPLEARVRLLELATSHGLFRAAAFSTGEMEAVRRLDLLQRVDLLALNRDEARSLAKLEDGPVEPEELAEAAIARIRDRHDHLLLSVTAGAAGSWSWDGSRLLHVPAVPVPVETTGGAGDAHLAGFLAALALELPVSTAHRLGVLLAAASVGSPHTIHKGLTRRDLADLAARAELGEEALLSLLGEGP